MKEWKYLLFLAKYHAERLLRKIINKKEGVFYIGGSDVFPPPLKPEEETVLLEQLGGEDDVMVKSVLIERNLRLVVYIARKFENTGINVEDLISIGTIGLIKGINTFNANKNIKLATYASRCIENEILMSLRWDKKLAGEVFFNEPIDFDSEGNPLTLLDIVSEDCDIPDRIDLKIKSERLAELLTNVLTPRERMIVCMRYGIGGGQERTQMELAKKLHISRSYVSRIEKKALSKLRSAYLNL